jgi:5'-deoxynucleotidase YfbR-like HD superfamily hydrolase
MAREAAEKKPRAWQRMLSGRRLDLLDPSPLDVEIGDIAHGLARVARWNGQTKGAHAFSVAQHSVLVEGLVAHFAPETEQRWRLAALLHDAPEYVVGDMISPFKAAMGLDYKSFENRLLAAVHLRFGLPAEIPERVSKLIKRADKAAAYLEATQLAGFSLAEGAVIFGLPRGLEPATAARGFFHLKPLPPDEAAEGFLKRFTLLDLSRPAGGARTP